MSDAELEAFYQEEYRRLYQGDQGPGKKDLQVQSLRANALLGFAQGYLPTVTRHLDIGCSAGLLLKRFQEAYGCEPVGIEPGTAYRQYAQEQGLVVYPSLELLGGQNSERFDLVSMAHVLEHLPEPVTYLANLRKDLLAKEGALLIEVPNLYAHDCFEIAHLVSYSQHTLRELLRAAGYTVLAFQQHGQPRSEIIPLYLTALARPLGQMERAEPVIPERWVRRKRRLGLLRRQMVSRFFPKRAWRPMTES
jgi:SAM-dependent methyltransferase